MEYSRHAGLIHLAAAVPVSPDNYMKAKTKELLIEALIFGLLVAAYFFLVLHFLGTWLKQLFDSNRTLYAFIALGTMIVQGIGLETFTNFIIQFIKSGRGNGD
jgi:hypothetical protein